METRANNARMKYSIAMAGIAVTCAVWLVNELAGKCVFIHCAQGHGRTGTVAGTLWMHNAKANDADDSVRLLREKRPGLGLNGAQMEFFNIMDR